jgi:hypothetical protein
MTKMELFITVPPLLTEDIFPWLAQLISHLTKA